MKKTPRLILDNARFLFNREGVNNVRLHDIAKHTDISPGNLSYHFKTKKDLIQALLDQLQTTSKDLRSGHMAYLEEEDYLSIIISFLRFQIGHRFFYRDILDLISLVPEAKELYKTQMNQVISFTKNGMYLAVGKGLWSPEVHKGSFHYFAKNIWAILNSWLIEREVLGEEQVSMEEVMTAIWEYHYPYFTDKGKELYPNLKEQIPSIVQDKIAAAN